MRHSRAPLGCDHDIDPTWVRNARLLLDQERPAATSPCQRQVGRSGRDAGDRDRAPPNRRGWIVFRIWMAEDRVKVIETFSTIDGKTKDMAAFLSKLGVVGNVLCVVSLKNFSTEKATHNIPNLKVSGAMYLNVYDVMNADVIIISRKSLEVVQGWLGKSAATVVKEAAK